MVKSTGNDTEGLLGDDAQSWLALGACMVNSNTPRVSLVCTVKPPLWAVTVKVELAGLIPGGSAIVIVMSLGTG